MISINIYLYTRRRCLYRLCYFCTSYRTVLPNKYIFGREKDIFIIYFFRTIVGLIFLRWFVWYIRQRLYHIFVGYGNIVKNNNRNCEVLDESRVKLFSCHLHIRIVLCDRYVVCYVYILFTSHVLMKERDSRIFSITFNMARSNKKGFVRICFCD